MMSAQRFTRDGADTLERHLLQTCEQVRKAVQELIPSYRLDGLLLGGGYGRGEGGCCALPKAIDPTTTWSFIS